MSVTAELDARECSLQELDRQLKKYKNVCISSYTVTLEGSPKEVNMLYQELNSISGQKDRGLNGATHHGVTTERYNNKEKELRFNTPFHIPHLGTDKRYSSSSQVGLQAQRSSSVGELKKMFSSPHINDTEEQLTRYKSNSSTSMYRDQQKQQTGRAKGAGGGAEWTRGAWYEEGKRGHTLVKAKRESDVKKVEVRGGTQQTCPICKEGFTKNGTLSCGHGFCRERLRQPVETRSATSPVYKTVFGKVEGNQPDGTMKSHVISTTLAGFSLCDTIVIDYYIPDGIQTEKHPNPGKPYHGTETQAFLPDNEEGRHVLRLLKRAFDQKLIFTVGTSSTTGVDSLVTWNGIHHKTSRYGGPQCYGYPDPDYLKRVKEELKAKGIE